MREQKINDAEEKKREEYELINSLSIGEYCRKIKHKFNTEELSVLIYRNKRMSIDEKISKYEELIKNYPDMEVIERINCKHHDSVKELIKGEIKRLQELKAKFLKQEDTVVYFFEAYYKSTRKWDNHIIIQNNIMATYREIDEAIAKEIEEYEDIIAYRIYKKHLIRNNPIITAEYQVINNKRILNNIFDSENDFLDIDNIYIKIPTPFKKGDILATWDYVPYRKGIDAKNEDVFVIDYMSTWQKGLDELLAEGNRDSSDMIGYGYFVIEDSNKVIFDNKWNYDSFEYFKGKLDGKYRILKAISSLIKNKISIELFLDAYEEFKIENRINMGNWYTKEGLKLAGFSDDDIKKLKSEIVV